MRGEAADEVRDLVGDLGVDGVVAVAPERVDRQIALDQPHVARARVGEELPAVLLLRVGRVVLQLTLQVEENEADTVDGELCEEVERELALAAASYFYPRQISLLLASSFGTRCFGSIPSITSRSSSRQPRSHSLRSISHVSG